MPIKYYQCSTAQQKQANKFFKRYKTNVSCNHHDLVFCASNTDGDIVAAVLIRTMQPEVTLFRSLYVAPNARGNGIATALCQFALTKYQSTCFTLCKTELADFYQNLGFVLATEDLALPMVEKQIKKGLLLMRRPVNSSL